MKENDIKTCIDKPIEEYTFINKNISVLKKKGKNCRIYFWFEQKCSNSYGI